MAVDGNEVEAGEGRARDRLGVAADPRHELRAAACSTPPATWLLNEQPARLAVVGAGASGAEIASAFGRFGTEVVLIEMLDQILPAEDAEIAKVVASELRKQNIKVATGTRVEEVKAGKDSVEITYGGEHARASTTCASPRAARPTSRGSASTRPA